MKTLTTAAFVATTLFAGSAMAFNEDMTDYPRNVVVEQQTSITRADVQADLAAHTPSTARGAMIDYPALTDQPATMLTREQVQEELARFVGNGFREGINTVDHPLRG